MLKWLRNLNLKINPWIIYIYVVLYLVIIQSGSVQLSIINANGQSKKYAVALLLMLIPFAVIEFSRFKREYINICIALAFFLAIDMIIYPSTFSSLLMKSLWFIGFIGFSAFWRKHNKNIFDYFSKLIFLLACIAIIMWLITCLAGHVIPGLVGYEIADITYYSWHNLYSYTTFNSYYYNFLGKTLYRLHGLFWEPGVYQIHLNLAIYHFLFEKHGKNKFILAILYLNLILTLSTTGLCIGIMLLTVYIVNLRKFRKSRQIMILLGGVVASLACIILLGKKMVASMQYGWHGSMAARIDDQIVALKLFIHNFIFGAGYDNGQLFLDTQGWGRGCTSGLLSWSYMMGIFGLIAVLYPFFKNIKHANNKNDRRNRIIVFLIFVICNLSEPLYWAPLNWFWVASGYVILFCERRTLNESTREKDSLYRSEVF